MTEKLQLDLTAQAFNKRVAQIEPSPDILTWMGDLFRDEELLFLFRHGGGFLLEITAVNPTMPTEAEIIAENEDTKSEEVDKPGKLKITIHKPEVTLANPKADVSSNDEAETLILGATQSKVLDRLRRFLIQEHNAGRTMISVAIATSSELVSSDDTSE